MAISSMLSVRLCGEIAGAASITLSFLVTLRMVLRWNPFPPVSVLSTDINEGVLT